MSPGWHWRTSQIALSVENRIARALPVFKIDKFAIVIPVASDSAVSVIPLCESTASNVTSTRCGNGLDDIVELLPHARPLPKRRPQRQRQHSRKEQRHGK